MFKNVATKIVLFAFDTTTSAPKTGDAANITAYVSKDYGAVTILGDTSATEIDATNAKGWYAFDVAQAETNADVLLFTAKSATANVSIVGQYIHTTPNRFTTLTVDASGNVSTTAYLKKGVAATKFSFLMTDSTNHAPATGKTVTVTRCIDGTGGFAVGTLTGVSEIGNGMYTVDFGASDLNGNCIVLRATATGCDDAIERILTTP